MATSKLAARPKLQQTFEQTFKPQVQLDMAAWESVYKRAKEIYSELKTTNPSIVLDDALVKQNIKDKLASEMTVEENMANLAALSVLTSDSKWRKQQKTTKTSFSSKTKKQAQSESEDFSDYNNIKPNIYYVKVIYSDVDENGQSTQEAFTIDVPFSDENVTNENIVQKAWEMLDDPNGTAKPRNVRSPMVGDVFIVNQIPYVALGIGFSEISKEELEKWKKVPTKNKLMAFDEQRMEDMIRNAFSKKNIKTSNSTIEQCETCNIKKANTQNMDKNTLFVGKILSIQDAIRMCKNKFNKLPKIGFEIEIDKGLVKTKYEIGREDGFPLYGQQHSEYITYLQNNSGTYRVWTYISPTPKIEG